MRTLSINPSHPHLRILLCNDDGVHAPGLKTLEKIARTITDDIWIVAPEYEQSGVGHSLSLRRPLRLREISPKRYAVDGTPTDCMVIAIKHLMANHRPDLVLSGVNNGGNLGEDVTYSGTVAAAMEATLLGVPAIAFSQAKRNKKVCKWTTAETHGPALVRQLLDLSWGENVLINVNFPNVEAADVKGLQVVAQGERQLSGELVEWEDPFGEAYFWIGALRDEEHPPENTDLWAVHHGYIAVTPLHLDLTHYPTLQQFSSRFNASFTPLVDAYKNSSGKG